MTLDHENGAAPRGSIRLVSQPPIDMPEGETPEMDSEEIMRAELEGLRERHRDLDLAIDALAERGTDPLSVRRLKKRKLMLRDRIAHLEDQLTPDIIA